jgi:hypothetical protein
MTTTPTPVTRASAELDPVAVARSADYPADEFVAGLMRDMGIVNSTVCAKCLLTFEIHSLHREKGGRDCGEFTPCIEHKEPTP